MFQPKCDKTLKIEVIYSPPKETDNYLVSSKSQQQKTKGKKNKNKNNNNSNKKENESEKIIQNLRFFL